MTDPGQIIQHSRLPSICQIVFYLFLFRRAYLCWWRFEAIPPDRWMLVPAKCAICQPDKTKSVLTCQVLLIKLTHTLFPKMIDISRERSLIFPEISNLPGQNRGQMFTDRKTDTSLCRGEIQGSTEVVLVAACWEMGTPTVMYRELKSLLMYTFFYIGDANSVFFFRRIASEGANFIVRTSS